MYYWSEKTNKKYSTEKECIEAEKVFDAEQAKAKALAEKKSADRKAAAEKVETARQVAVEANKAYHDALNEFCKEYGTWHASYSGSDISDLFDWFFKL